MTLYFIAKRFFGGRRKQAAQDDAFRVGKLQKRQIVPMNRFVAEGVAENLGDLRGRNPDELSERA